MYYTKDLQLVGVTEDDAKELYKGWNDYWGQACYDSPDSFTVPETFNELYDNIKNGGLAFMVKKRDGTIIGYASIFVSYIPQVARPALFILEPYRGKGYGTQVMAALLYISFQECNARKVSLVVYGLNGAGQAIYLKMGFTEEGRRKDEIYRQGRYWDVVAMGLFKNTWKEMIQGCRLPAVDTKPWDMKPFCEKRTNDGEAWREGGNL